MRTTVPAVLEYSGFASGEGRLSGGGWISWRSFRSLLPPDPGLFRIGEQRLRKLLGGCRQNCTYLVFKLYFWVYFDAISSYSIFTISEPGSTVACCRSPQSFETFMITWDRVSFALTQSNLNQIQPFNSNLDTKGVRGHPKPTKRLSVYLPFLLNKADGDMTCLVV